MGPVSMDWYRQRGLTHKKIHTATRDDMFVNEGETYETEAVTEHYSCGRIDVRGIPDEPYGDEIGVPPMRSEDWRAFGRWLDDVETMSVWTLRDLVTAYQNQTGQTIHWDTYEQQKV